FIRKQIEMLQARSCAQITVKCGLGNMSALGETEISQRRKIVNWRRLDPEPEVSDHRTKIVAGIFEHGCAFD
ncbi:MAG: hypothetical protein VXV84_02690, partial [Pseudomonadota bacterium]|nr:hypothetical protein [Pseudomonadota bacterium]